MGVSLLYVRKEFIRTQIIPFSLHVLVAGLATFKNIKIEFEHSIKCYNGEKPN